MVESRQSRVGSFGSASPPASCLKHTAVTGCPLNVGVLGITRSEPDDPVTPAEISEVILQVAIYGGVPAGVDATKIAKAAIAEAEAEEAPNA